MKAKKMLTILVVILGLMVWQVEVSEAEPMGTAWTYQGRLMDANGPADGLYDFEFKLWMDPCEIVYPPQVGDTLTINDLDVIDGYFTVEIDFNSPFAFNGYARWLEISVRPGNCNDVNDYVTLTPRQEVTPTPYALQTRGIFVDDRMNIGMGTTSPKGKLHVDGGKAADDTDAGDITIKAQDGGDAVRGLRGGRGGDIILLPGEGGESPPLTKPGPSGNVGIGTAGPEAMLDVRGNVKVDQKIQAYDSGGLELATDEGTTRIFVADDGKVGIGTTTPQASLEVTNTGSSHAIWASTNDIPVYAHRTSTGGSWPAVAGDCNSEANSASGVRGRILSTNPGSLGAGVYGYNYGTGSNGVGVRGHHAGNGYAGYFTGGKNYFEGSVGIGTTSPGAKLEVKQNDWQDIVKVGTPDTSNRLILSSGPDYASVSGGQTNQNSIVISHSTGNVGIGQSGTLPEAKLQVNGDLKVKGAYIGTFPRPAFDSGWHEVAMGSFMTFGHNLGGNVDNYVVDMQFKRSDIGINNWEIGGTRDDVEGQSGAYWRELTSSSITVHHNPDGVGIGKIRIRIWIYE